MAFFILTSERQRLVPIVLECRREWRRKEISTDKPEKWACVILFYSGCKFSWHFHLLKASRNACLTNVHWRKKRRKYALYTTEQHDAHQQNWTPPQPPCRSRRGENQTPSLTHSLCVFTSTHSSKLDLWALGYIIMQFQWIFSINWGIKLVIL